MNTRPETRDILVGLTCFIVGTVILVSALVINSTFAQEGAYESVEVTAEENHRMLLEIQRQCDILVIRKKEFEK